MLDVTLLKIMKYKSDYYKLKDIVTSCIDPITYQLVQEFGKYFKKFPEHNVIDFKVFIPSFKRTNSHLSDDQFAVYMNVIRNIQDDADECTKDGILDEIFELNLGTKLANICNKFDQGELQTPLIHAINSEIDTYKIGAGVSLNSWIDADIGELLKEDIEVSGITYRLQCLRESMRPMRGGDFGILAGRPDKGKTTFLASEATYWASQLPEDKNILWFNNESAGKRIVPRLYQAALGKGVKDLISLGNDKLTAEYEKIVGRRDKIRVIDVHGWHIGQIESAIETQNAGLVIYDMIDHIKGFGNEARTDLQLEEMYKWARERCVKHDVIGIATSQISNDGDGLMYPTLGMLKDSKTGKQGACDFIIMIGSSNDRNLQGSRFIGMPKNKLRREGFKGDPQCEVLFKPEIARYEDIEIGE